MENQPVVVFHPGTQHSWQTARALQDLRRLAFYATSLHYDPARMPWRLESLPGPQRAALRREFSRYRIPGLDPALIHSGGLWELAERLAARLGLRRAAAELDLLGNRFFVNQLRADITSDRPFALWGYNNSSLEAFALGKAHGRLCILDRTIGDRRAYDRAMLALEDRYGDWFHGRYHPTDPRILEREDREYALADRIVVGCDFALETVRAEARDTSVADRIEVLEYCYDPRFDGCVPRVRDRSGPVRFLFAGLGIPRKGIHHVLEAIARFPRSAAELTILGSIDVPASTLAPYSDRFTHIPTVPRHEVPAVMADHDVLLFPTYFEGAGIVLYEALACGLALIQSDCAALAVSPETGLLLERPGTEELVVAMETCITDRERLAAWRAAAPRAAQDYRFDGYTHRVGALLDRMGLGPTGV